MVIAYEYIISQGGIESAFTNRYKGVDNQSCTFSPLNSVASLYDYQELPSGDEELLKLAVANVGPVAVAIDASQPTFLSYKSGIYDDSKCTGTPNHAGEFNDRQPSHVCHKFYLFFSFNCRLRD